MIAMNEAQRKQLEEEGYILLKHVLSKQQVASLISRLEELWLEEGDRAGEEVIIEAGARRLANLVNKGELFRPIFTHSLILGAARVVLGPKIRLSSLNARSVPPHSNPKMPLHSDTDYGGKPDKTGFNSFTAIWMLDDFTHKNGATRIVPGTHLDSVVPYEVLADIYASHPAEVIMEGKAGDVLVYNGHCWHAGGENTTDGQRRALLVLYTRVDYPQQTDQRKYLLPEVQSSMTSLEREILGLNDGIIIRTLRKNIILKQLKWRLRKRIGM